MKKLLVYSLVVLLPVCHLAGQDRVVEGIITVFDSISLSGVSIGVKSSGEAVQSDTLGRFNVTCQPKDKLQIVANGFYKRNVKLKEETKYVMVNMKLKPGPENREVAIGYGYITDMDKFGAAMALNENNIDFSTYQDVFEAIKGRFPGVQVSGQEIIIRGGSSINMSNAALLVLDGMVVDASTLNAVPTSQLKSINMLKGPDASIYGVRGANGVVLVETKSGGD
jgi:TonB-dependent SusC/RagA subfamily outer membrane receptor